MLPLCLRSIAEHFDEIVVLDDASTDGTWEAAGDALCGHPRHELIRNLEPAGWIESRRRLMEATDSDYLFFLDADDVLCEYNADLLREIPEGRQPVVRLQLAELWGAFDHTTGRACHYDRCHTFVDRRRVRDLQWGGGTAARPSAGGGWAAALGRGPLLYHCKGCKPDARLVERSVIRAWLRAGLPDTLEAYAELAGMTRAEIHARAVRMLLTSRTDPIRRLDARMPRRPRVIEEAPRRFEIVYDGERPFDRIDHWEDRP